MLPYDCILSILDAIDNQLDKEEATRAFASLSLLSLSWSTAAQEYLYRVPTFHPSVTFRRASAFLRTLEARPDLAQRIRALEMGVWTTALKTEAKADRRVLSRWAVDVLRACPMMTKLDFPSVTYADASELETTLSRMSEVEEIILGEGLRLKDPWIIHVDLSIRDAFGSATFTIDDIARITAPSRWPKLRSLEVRAPLSHSTRRRSLPSHLTCALQGVVIAFNPNIMIDFPDVEALLSGSKDSLQSLSVLEHQLSSGTFVQTLKEFGSTLTSLSTTSLNQHELVSEELLSTIGTHCHSLKHLHLGSRFRATKANFALLSQLPVLEHLVLNSINYLAVPSTRFPRVERIETDEVAEVLESFVSPHLDTITLGSEDRTLSEWDANVLWKEQEVMELEGRLFKNRGVRLMCHEFFPSFAGGSLRSLMAWSRLEV